MPPATDPLAVAETWRSGRRIVWYKLDVDPFRPEIDGLFVVLVGNFNPAIFQPAWLGNHRIASAPEVENAMIEIIRPELAAYSLGPFRFTVQLDRFQIETLQPDQGFRMIDLIGSIFGVLKETPIRQMGINRTMHFKMPSEDEWHTVGHRLAPKEIWKDIMDSPGTISVSVRGLRPGAESKYFQIRAEPSTQLTPGVFVQTTEHFENATGSALWAGEMLNKSWNESQSYALMAACKLLEACLQP